MFLRKRDYIEIYNLNIIFFWSIFLALKNIVITIYFILENNNSISSNKGMIIMEIDEKETIKKICLEYLEENSQEQIEEFTAVFAPAYDTINESLIENSESTEQANEDGELAFFPENLGIAIITTIIIVVFNFVKGLIKIVIYETMIAKKVDKVLDKISKKLIEKGISKKLVLKLKEYTKKYIQSMDKQIDKK